jgi:serine/threonine protein kinase
LVVLIYNILCAIQFLHSANIMHRDIKPGNIMVDENCAVTIIDFGMARSIDSFQENEEECFYRGLSKEDLSLRGISSDFTNSSTLLKILDETSPNLTQDQLK